jgi:hypothetical protein
MMQASQAENRRLDMPLAAVAYSRPSEKPNAGSLANSVSHFGYAIFHRKGEPLTVKLKLNATITELFKLRPQKSKGSFSKDISKVHLNKKAIKESGPDRHVSGIAVSECGRF